MLFKTFFVSEEVLVNNSFSGSMVRKSRFCEIPSYGCSDERTSGLGRDGEIPDVIMIFMGINDWGSGADPKPGCESDDISVFSVAYRKMLEKLQKNYPGTELWCFTLPVSTQKNKANFSSKFAELL